MMNWNRSDKFQLPYIFKSYHIVTPVYRQSLVAVLCMSFGRFIKSEPYDGVLQMTLFGLLENRITYAEPKAKEFRSLVPNDNYPATISRKLLVTEFGIQVQ